MRGLLVDEILEDLHRLLSAADRTTSEGSFSAPVSIQKASEVSSDSSGRDLALYSEQLNIVKL